LGNIIPGYRDAPVNLEKVLFVEDGDQTATAFNRQGKAAIQAGTRGSILGIVQDSDGNIFKGTTISSMYDTGYHGKAFRCIGCKGGVTRYLILVVVSK
jgi:hypothetical protein